MTEAIVKALEELGSECYAGQYETGKDSQSLAPKPSLSEPAIGQPISHCQIIDISKQLKFKGYEYHLDILLCGSNIWLPPANPKPEPTLEYKALMARLRREEESRAYDRMINPSLTRENFSQRFPTASAAYAFSSTAAYESLNSTVEEDDITYTDVNRQVALIFNILVSIAACAAAIWMAARWWDTPARLALSMSGSLLVGVAEVVVYSGYIRRLGEAKRKEGTMKEVKEIVNTWIVGAEVDKSRTQSIGSAAFMGEDERNTVRKRKRQKEL